MSEHTTSDEMPEDAIFGALFAASGESTDEPPGYDVDAGQRRFAAWLTDNAAVVETGQTSARRPQAAAEPAQLDVAVTARHPAAIGEWGRVSEDGLAYVRTALGERLIGSWARGTPEEGLAFYRRRYDELRVEVDLLYKRLTTPGQYDEYADVSIARLREALAEPHAIGDLDALHSRLDKLCEITEQHRAAAREARAQQQADAAAHKQRIVSEAEALAGSSDWRATDKQLRALADEWKSAPRLDRRLDDALWSRFIAACSAFAKRRNAAFAQLAAERKETRLRKEALVDEAESLAESTEWESTARRFLDLMKQWKTAGRAQREVEDELWERFKTAQDTFFTARNADLKQQYDGFRQNQARKEELLAEAQKLLPVTDPDAARQALRSIQARWEEIGPVPRDVKPRLEGALREVEQAKADSEQALVDPARAERKRTTAEVRARAEATVRHLEASIAKFEDELEKARNASQQRKISDAEAALVARHEGLEQAHTTRDESAT